LFWVLDVSKRSWTKFPEPFEIVVIKVLTGDDKTLPWRSWKLRNTPRRLTASPARIGAAHDAAPPLAHLEASRAVRGFAAPARGAPFLARGVVRSRRKTSRAVIARTIIDGSTSDMRESSGVSKWQAGEVFDREGSLTLPRQQSEHHRASNVGLGISSNFDEISPSI
jgi:hypothetical protein